MMRRYAVRLKLSATQCPAGIMPPRATRIVRAPDATAAKAAAMAERPGWNAYAARLDRGPGADH